MKKRIIKKIYANKGATSLPGMTGGADDIDIKNDMQRFGDSSQSFYESMVQIGKFQIKTDTIQVEWDNPDCPKCFSFSTTMYVDENAGENLLGTTFRERSVRMGDWPISGSGCCGTK